MENVDIAGIREALDDAGLSGMAIVDALERLADYLENDGAVSDCDTAAAILRLVANALA